MAGVAHVAQLQKQVGPELLLDVEVVRVHVAVAALEIVIAADAAGEFGGGGEEIRQEARRLVGEVDDRALDEEGEGARHGDERCAAGVEQLKTPTPARTTVLFVALQAMPTRGMKLFLSVIMGRSGRSGLFVWTRPTPG